MIRTRIQKLLGCDIKKSGFTQISGLSWGHPREYGYPGVTMAEQLSIDILRAQMAHAVAARNATPEVQAPEAPAEVPEKMWATENQQRLIHTMIFERFPA